MSVIIKKMETDEEIRGKARVACQAWHETYPGLISQDYLDTVTVEKCEKAAYDHPWNTFVAKDGERVVGFVFFGEDKEDRSVGEIFALYVLKEYYGTGLGCRLMDTALEQLKDYPVVRLWAVTGNARAIRFYEKCGFRPDGAEKYVDRLAAAGVRLTLEK